MTPRTTEDRLARRARGARMQANSFEVFVARMCALTAIAFVLSADTRDRSPIGRLLHPWDFLWVGGLLISAVLILTGLRWGKANLEVGGLIGLSAVAALQAIAVAVVVGASGLVSFGVFVAVTIACLHRARLIVHPSPPADRL